MPMRPCSSGKGMRRVCRKFQVQVPMGQKFTDQKKNKGEGGFQSLHFPWSKPITPFLGHGLSSYLSVLVL